MSQPGVELGVEKVGVVATVFSVFVDDILGRT